MKAATGPASSESAPDHAQSTREGARAAEPTAEVRGSDLAGTWTPRVVASAPDRAASAQADVSDMMAENIMLKAKLKVEHDRYDSLQGLLARELRNLRSHVEEEMQQFDEMRGERDEMAVERDRMIGERDQMKVEHDAMQADRDLMSAERQTALAERDRVASERDETAAACDQISAELLQVQAEREQIRAERDRVQAERDQARAERDQVQTERDQARAERDQLDAERDQLLVIRGEFEQQVRDLTARIASDEFEMKAVRGERDLWAARAEALAQPIFQTRAVA